MIINVMQNGKETVGSNKIVFVKVDWLYLTIIQQPNGIYNDITNN